MEKPNWNSPLPPSSRSSFFRKENIILLLFLLPLLFLAFLFASNSQNNEKAATEWQATAKDWEKQSLLYQEKLKESEKDVRRLEKRQIALSSEKASAEDESSLYKKLTRKLVRLTREQQRCSNSLTVLANQISRDNFSWLKQNSDRVVSLCDRAAASFQAIRREGP
jgi:septal ring factor EnvC (AmiA/AmiB activator)